MIALAAIRTAAPSLHAVDDGLIRHFDIDRFVDLRALRRQCLGQRLRLRYGPREAIQHIALAAVSLVNAIFQHSDGHLIRHKTARVHVALGLKAEGRARFDVRAENISGRDMRNSIVIRNPFRLCSFSGARSAEHDNLHCLLLC